MTSVNKFTQRHSTHGTAGIEDRSIRLREGLIPIPERLLLYHARGEVIFITGAGSSQPANLPSFRELVVDVYQHLDASVHAVLASLPPDACNKWEVLSAGLSDKQVAECNRFINGDYDVVLGMLERRMDGRTSPTSKVRRTVDKVIRSAGTRHVRIHSSLVRLADRGIATAIVTTNFDLLLERAARYLRKSIQSYSLGAIPRPSK